MRKNLENSVENKWNKDDEDECSTLILLGESAIIELEEILKK